MPRFKPKFDEVFAMNVYGEWHIELPDGSEIVEYLDGSGQHSFLDLWEEVPPGEGAVPENDGLNHTRCSHPIVTPKGICGICLYNTVTGQSIEEAEAALSKCADTPQSVGPTLHGIPERELAGDPPEPKENE